MKYKFSNIISVIWSKLLLSNWNLIIVRFISLLLSFSIGIVITRLLDFQSRGLYTIFTVNTAVGAIFILFGLNEFILKKLKSSPNLNFAPYLAYCSFFYLLFIFYIICLDLSLIIKINLFLSSLFSSIILFYRFYYINLDKYVKSELISIFSNLFFYILIILDYFLNSKLSKNFDSILFLYNTSLFLVALFYSIKIYHKLVFDFNKISHHLFSDNFFELLKFGLFGFLGIISSKFIYLLIQEKLFSQTIALLNITEVFPAFYSSIMLLFSYKITNSIYNCNINFLNQLLINSFFKLSFFLFPFFIIFFLFGEKIVSTLYGAKYSISGSLMYIQLFTVFFGLLSNFVIISFLKINKSHLAIISQLFNILFLYIAINSMNFINLKSILFLLFTSSFINFLINYLLFLFTLNKLNHVS